MRDVVFAVLVGLGVLIAGVLTALAIVDSQPTVHRQAHHPYEPFTIELSTRDR